MKTKQNISISGIEIPMDEQAEKAAIGALIDGAWREQIGVVERIGSTICETWTF